ncbi:MAG: tetratricopeptide repeat protein [Nodosilinea sp.]
MLLDGANSAWDYLDAAKALVDQKKLTEAVALYHEAIQLYPDRDVLYRELGVVQEKVGDTAGEIESYRKAISLQTEQPLWLYLTLGKLLSDQGQWEEALKVHQQGIEIYPQQADLYRGLGIAQENMGDSFGELESYRRAIELDPDQPIWVYLVLGQLLDEQEEVAGAIACYQQGIAQYPDNADLYRMLGVVQEKVDDFAGEINSYRKAIELKPQPLWVYTTLGSLLVEQGEDLDEAIAAYHKALELNAESHEGIHENLARAFCKAKRFPEAVSTYRKALELNSQNAYIYRELGDVYQELSDFESAVVVYRSALELKPDFRGVREQLNQALAQLSIRKEKAGSKTVNWPFEVETRQVPPTLPDGKPWPKISIVTPSLNQGKFIEETILSVIHQNYPNIEYILIDGGSTDQTIQIIGKYRQHFSYVVSEPDRGQAHAINKGFQQATGEILTWLNSDDRLAPGALYGVALAFYTSRADVIAGVCQLFRDGVEVEQHLTSCANGLLPLADLLDLENCWLRGKFFYQPEVMFTRKIWEQAGGAVDESLFYSMDYELWVRFAAQKAMLHVIGCPIAQYRMHPEQKTSAVDQYEPELRQVREALSARYNCPVPQSAAAKPMKRHLRIAMVNDVGHLGGAGIAHTRIGQALALAGHEVIPIAGTLDWSLTPVDCSAEEVYQKVSEVNPDLVVVGNLHGMKYPVEILDRLTDHFYTIFVMHDQWLLTGRCAYTGTCEKYMMHCDAECPTSHEYPSMEPESIADAFTEKHNLIFNKERLLILGVSNWLTNWAKYALMHHRSPQASAEVNRKFQSIYCGLDLEVFCPHDKLESRRQLKLPEDKLIILTGSDSVEDRRKGLQDLVLALKIAALDNVMVVSFGSGNLNNLSADGIEVHHLGYIAQPLLASYYSAADLFISPSHEEAFGQTFIEASACGTLSVGYGIGGVKEAIKDGVSGKIVATKTVESLAKIIKKLCLDANKRSLTNTTSSIYAANNFSLRSSYHCFMATLQESDWLERLALQPLSRFSALTTKLPQHRVIKTQLISNNLLSLYDKGDSLLLQGEYEAASIAYRDAVELNSEDALSYYKLGKALFYLEDWQNSVEALRKAIELKHDFAEAYCYLGDTLATQQDWDGAIEAYTKAIEYNYALSDSIYERLGEALNQCQLQKQENDRLLEIEQELLAKHPLPYKIFLPTEKMPVGQRVEGLRRVIDIYENRWQQYYQPKLLELREQYKDHKRAFIIGNGPSINLTDLDLLKDEVTFGVNGIFLKSRDTGFVPTFYVVEDHLVAEDRQEAIANFQGSIKLFPISLAYCIQEKSDTLFFDHRPRKSYPDGFDFSTDASICTYTGCTVTFTCMQLAYFLGFKEIYLIGVDCDYSIPEDIKVDQEYAVGTLDMDSDDKNHFHPDYFGKGYRWHDPQVHKMKEAYQEARRVCNETEVDMCNATIGGKLEVFPRISYYSLFNINKAYPRVLIIDMTRMGSVSATGQIKKTLFSLWPKANLLQVYTIGSEGTGLFSEAELYLKQEQALDELSILNECRRFKPALIYYRPLADKPYFHNFALHLIEELKVPVVTHIMDDWMDRLLHRNPDLYGEFDASLRILLDQSSLRLSICDSMSLAFQERYNMDFIPFANCVEPEEWIHDELSEIEEKSIEEQFTIRYVGGLADDMNFASICDIVKVVASLHKEIKICFEIYTPAHWMEKAISEFSSSPGVSIYEANFSSEGYRKLLCSANALVIAYNFDEISLRYTRYSMANKLPECLASAVPVLVYGPEAIATVEYAVQTSTVLSVTEQNCQMLEEAIRNLIQNYQNYQELAQRARTVAFEYHNAHQKRLQFSNMIRHSAAFGRAVSELPILTLSLDLVGKFARDKHASIDEIQLIARISSQLQEIALINTSNSSSSSLDELAESNSQQYSVYHISPETIKEGIVHHQEISQKHSILAIHDSAESQRVLESFPWESLIPDVIQCGFDKETKNSAQLHCDELATLLSAKGYTVLVSEWHPRILSRIRQDWCRLTRYPCTVHEDSWGYLIAFKQKPDFSKVVSAGRQITRVTPSNAANAKLYWESGKSYIKKGEISKAIDELLLSIEMAPERYDSYFQMAELLFKQKRPDEAMTYYHNVIELNSNHHWSWRSLGGPIQI